MKYRLSQIAAVVGGRFSGTDCEVQSVVTDSRSLTCELGSVSYTHLTLPTSDLV